MGAITLSMGLHFAILEIDVMSTVFQITTLNLEEWIAVLKISFPVIVIDEVLKFFARRITDVAVAVDPMAVDKK